MKKFTPGKVPYYRVFGERKASTLDEKSGRTVYTDEILPERTRYETLSLRDAEAFATTVYRAENIVLSIDEMPPKAA